SLKQKYIHLVLQLVHKPTREIDLPNQALGHAFPSPARHMSPLPTIYSRRTTLTSPPANTTNQALQVVCAWPVSGQYGPGARILYYVLIVACIFARKTEWLRNACLAAALLLPAVAAIHGIVLAAAHADTAVDMDIYGTLQLCAIGALAAPVTARRSETYFKTPGRNTIFVWAAIVLAGLLSLAVEFYRSSNIQVAAAEGCTRSDFIYGISKCNLTCNPDDGPFSPIRGGSANNIDVIIAPHIITFNAGMLLAAACCIPAILLLISLSIQIFESELKPKSHANGTPEANEQGGDEPQRRDSNVKVGAGPDVQTLEQSRADPHNPSDNVSQGSESGDDADVRSRAVRMVKLFQKSFEVPVFGAAILAIVIIGERNFFSKPIKFDTEPMANVGQWSPIAGIVLTILGSVYLLLAEAIEYERGPAAARSGYIRRAENHKPSDLALRGARYSMELGKELRKRFHRDHENISKIEEQGQGIPEIPGEKNRNAQTMHYAAYSSGDRSSRSPVRSERSANVHGPRLRSPDSGVTRGETLDPPSSPHYRSSSLDANQISWEASVSPKIERASLSLQHTVSAPEAGRLKRRTESFSVHNGHAATGDVPETPDIMVTTESRVVSRRPSLAVSGADEGKRRSC
ncbi:transferase family III protein, partial [Teratosphaeria destructans]